MITAKFILNNYIKSVFLNTGKKAGNCSYFYQNGKQYILLRETDYIYGRVPTGTAANFGRSGPSQMYLENDGTNIVHSNEAIYEKNGTELKFIKYLTKAEGNDWGYEDPRCVNWNNENYILFARRKIGHWQKFQIYLCKIDNDLNFKILSINDGQQLIEKNWLPIEDQPGKCMYSLNPCKIIDLFKNTYINVKNNSVNLRGSSNIIKYNNGYLGLYHIRNEAFEYIHYFVLFDKELHIIQISEPFSFFGANVEFNCYLEYKDGKIIVPISVHDQLIYEFKIDDNIIKNILNKSLNNNTKNQKIFSKFYDDAKKSNNIFAALVLAGYSYDLNVISDAVIKNHTYNYFRDQKFRENLQKLLINNSKKI